MNQHFEGIEMMTERIFGSDKSLIVAGANVFNDYTRFAGSQDEAAELKRRGDEMLVEGCKKAFDLGARLVEK